MIDRYSLIAFESYMVMRRLMKNMSTFPEMPAVHIAKRVDTSGNETNKLSLKASGLVFGLNFLKSVGGNVGTHSFLWPYFVVAVTFSSIFTSLSSCSSFTRFGVW